LSKSVAEPDNSKNAKYVAGKDQNIKDLSDSANIKMGHFRECFCMNSYSYINSGMPEF
jgi:hypothetical protein